MTKKDDKPIPLTNFKQEGFELINKLEESLAKVAAKYEKKVAREAKRTVKKEI